nr:HNH endonuclease signature motif containing protein [Bosea sp. AK1]
MHGFVAKAPQPSGRPRSERSGLIRCHLYHPGIALPASRLSRNAKQVDERRGSARDRGYSARWDRASLAFKAQHPLCVGCEARGRTVPAEIVDHIVPHRGDQGLFWDVGNWQSCCRICRDRVKARLEVMWHRGEIGASALRLTSKRAMAIGREVFGEIAQTQ